MSEAKMPEPARLYEINEEIISLLDRTKELEEAIDNLGIALLPVLDEKPSCQEKGVDEADRTCRVARDIQEGRRAVARTITRIRVLKDSLQFS